MQRIATCLCLAALLLACAGSAAEPQHTPAAGEFTMAAANAALDRIQQGLDTHDLDLLLSAFNPQQMLGYASFRDQVRSLFAKYESFRSFYSISDLRAENGRGIVLVDFVMEAVQAGATAPPVRTQAQIRFDMAPGPRGWQVVNLDPRSFFS